MPVVTITESLMHRLTVSDGRILRDRILAGFCVRAGSRQRTFIITTSCKGQQVRLSLGAWPLLSVEDARGIATKILKDCRAGIAPLRHDHRQLPILKDAIDDYAKAKGIKASSLKRYHSILRTHFAEWQSQSVMALNTPSFARRCHEFAQTKGAALVEVGRGLIGALIKYLNAVHSLTIRNPFHHLADAGLMPERAKPRPRKLQETELPAWRVAVDQMPDLQRDYLMMIAFTGLRRNECAGIHPQHVDLYKRVLHIPETKNGHPHSLPITPLMEQILERRMAGIQPDRAIFAGIAAEHVSGMAERLGSPKFMLHDIRKLLATVGEQLGLSDAIKRRILNHVSQRGDTLHRHYVSLSVDDIREPLIVVQQRLQKLMCS